MQLTRPVVELLAGLAPWQGIPVIVVGFLALAALVHTLGDRFVRQVTARIDGDVDDIVFRSLHTALYVSLGLVGAYVATDFYDVSPGIAVPLEAGTLSAIIVVWMVTLIRLGRKVSTAVTDSKYIDRQMLPILQNVWSAVISIVGIFLLLVLWEIDVTPLLASAGIVGIIVGLAARDTLANFFGSLSLYLDGTYRVGDYVVLESGERGRVEDISVRSTVVRTRDDILVTVPNATLNSAAIINESTPKRNRRIRVPIGVAYGTDIDVVEEILLEIAESEALVRERPSPRVRFREFGDSALNFELLCWVSNPAVAARAVHHLNSAIYRRFQADGIEIPFPKRDISVRTADAAVPFETVPESGAGELSTDGGH